MTIATAWCEVDPPVTTTWFGADLHIEELLRRRPSVDAIPTIVGPSGPAGASGEISWSSTNW